jgi:hypothetical protein
VSPASRGHLGQVGDHEDLVMAGHVGQLPPHGHRHRAPHPGIHLVEDQGRDPVHSRQNGLEGQHDPGELAPGGDLRELVRSEPRVERGQEAHALGAPASHLGEGLEADLETGAGEPQLGEEFPDLDGQALGPLGPANREFLRGRRELAGGRAQRPVELVAGHLGPVQFGQFLLEGAGRGQDAVQPRAVLPAQPVEGVEAHAECLGPAGVDLDPRGVAARAPSGLGDLVESGVHEFRQGGQLGIEARQLPEAVAGTGQHLRGRALTGIESLVHRVGALDQLLGVVGAGQFLLEARLLVGFGRHGPDLVELEAEEVGAPGELPCAGLALRLRVTQRLQGRGGSSRHPGRRGLGAGEGIEDGALLRRVPEASGGRAARAGPPAPARRRPRPPPWPGTR